MMYVQQINPCIGLETPHHCCPFKAHFVCASVAGNDDGQSLSPSPGISCENERSFQDFHTRRWQAIESGIKKQQRRVLGSIVIDDSLPGLGVEGQKAKQDKTRHKKNKTRADRQTGRPQDLGMWLEWLKWADSRKRGFNHATTTF
jgi:hypothetical protein